MTSFREQTCWTPTGPGSWRSTIDPSWGQGRATYGGIITGAALEAMSSLVLPQRTPRSIQTTFVGPVAPGPATLEARILREGRAMTTVEARIHQGETVRAAFLAGFGADRSSRIIVTPPPWQATEPAADSVEMPYIPGLTPAFTQHFHYRWEGGRFPFSGSDTAISSGWCRHRTETGSPHVATVGLLDAWPAPLLTIADRPFPASTVTWTASFVDVPEQPDPNGWWYFRATPHHSAGGYATTHGELYTPGGHLAAHMDQLVALFDA